MRRGRAGKRPWIARVSPDGKMIVASEFLASEAGVSALDLFDAKNVDKKTFKTSDLNLGSPVWLPDQSAILVAASGRDSNFNRAQIGEFSYPGGVYRAITNDTNSYPSISLSADGKTALIGGRQDNNNAGAVWVFTETVPQRRRSVKH